MQREPSCRPAAPRCGRSVTEPHALDRRSPILFLGVSGDLRSTQVRGHRPAHNRGSGAGSQTRAQQGQLRCGVTRPRTTGGAQQSGAAPRCGRSVTEPHALDRRSPILFLGAYGDLRSTQVRGLRPAHNRGSGAGSQTRAQQCPQVWSHRPAHNRGRTTERCCASLWPICDRATCARPEVSDSFLGSVWRPSVNSGAGSQTRAQQGTTRVQVRGHRPTHNRGQLRCGVADPRTTVSQTRAQQSSRQLSLVATSRAIVAIETVRGSKFRVTTSAATGRLTATAECL